MTYFCIFGRTPELSLAELLAVLPHYTTSFRIITSSPAGCIFVSEDSIHLPGLMRRLGGTIKLGEIITATPISTKDADLTEFFQSDAITWLPLSGRATLGFSIYSLTHSPQKNQQFTERINRLFLALKKSLRTAERSIRIVTPGTKESDLSAVTVEKNHLLDGEGAEYVFLRTDEATTHIGRTIAVQPFEAYAARDFERPSRTMTTGLLPPKLAQIMINLGGIFPSDKTIIWDPFCGFGTIAQEALLLDFAHSINSDIDAERVTDTIENLAWLAKEFSVDTTRTEVAAHDATQTPTLLNNRTVDLIVTEGFLGPIISQHAASKDIDRAASEVTVLLKKALPQLASTLSEDGRIIISLPVWLSAQLHRFIDLKSILPKGLKALSLFSSAPSWAKPTERNTVVYSRAGQQVGREIVVLASTKN